MAKVCQLFSGSNGNSILISANGNNFLVDIGVSAKRCENALLDVGVDPDSINGIFITHEHCDHVKGVRVFAKRHKVPVFANFECVDAMLEAETIDSDVHIELLDYHTELGGIEIRSFAQSHDSANCVGYRFNLPEGRSVGVCTDTGYVTDNAKEQLKGVDMIFLESNHEVSMVQTGSYSYMLKKRILGARGHLSNFDSSEYIKTLAQDGTTRFVLCHLSLENNMPEIARQTALSALSEIRLKEGTDYRLYVSPTQNDSRCIAL